MYLLGKLRLLMFFLWPAPLCTTLMLMMAGNCDLYRAVFIVTQKYIRLQELIIVRHCLITTMFAPLSDIPMFYIKYLTMHKVHMHAGAIRQVCMVEYMNGR